MKTKLEQIENANELITFTLCFGIPTDTESICRMQDIIGHATVGELAALAEDTGKDGKVGTQKPLMNLLFVIWNWEDATRFYNQHVNTEYLEAKAAAKEAHNMKEKATAWEKSAATIKDKWQAAEVEAEKQKQRADAAEAEVLKLKAMLFDYMTKTA